MSKKRRKSKKRLPNIARTINTAKVTSATNATRDTSKEEPSSPPKKAYDERFIEKYTLALLNLGMEEEEIADHLMVVTEFINEAYVTGSRDFEGIFAHVLLGKRTKRIYLKDMLEREIRTVKNAFWRNYGEVKGPVIRNKIFGDSYADMSDPETFIFGIADYLTRN